MANSCETYPDEIWDAYNYADERLSFLVSAISNLQSHSCYSGSSNCRTFKRFRDINMQYIITALIYGHREKQDTFRTAFMFKFCLGEKLTMRAVLDEMFTASNEELKQFIGLVDAYRQSLWNKPFDKEFWAATARGFEIWE